MAASSVPPKYHHLRRPKRPQPLDLSENTPTSGVAIASATWPDNKTPCARINGKKADTGFDARELDKKSIAGRRIATTTHTTHRGAL